MKAIDWGQGLYAAAQREILEVLINEPGLFHGIDQEISESLFDVPVLREAANALWDAIRSDDDFSLNSVLARTQSVSVAECLVELQRVGEEKGNYHARLTDALGVLSRRAERSKTIVTDSVRKDADSGGVDDGAVVRQNPHSLGML